MNSILTEVICITIVLLIVFMEILFFTQRIYQRKHPIFHTEENGIFTVHIYTSTTRGTLGSYEKLPFKRLEDGSFKYAPTEEEKKSAQKLFIALTVMYVFVFVSALIALTKLQVLYLLIMVLIYVALIAFFWCWSMNLRRQAKRYLKKNVF